MMPSAGASGFYTSWHCRNFRSHTTALAVQRAPPARPLFSLSLPPFASHAHTLALCLASPSHSCPCLLLGSMHQAVLGSTTRVTLQLKIIYDCKTT